MNENTVQSININETVIVYIQFNGENTHWDNVLDNWRLPIDEHIHYYPKDVLQLHSFLNQFHYHIPMTFRKLYACREFDMIGFFHINELNNILQFFENNQKLLDKVDATIIGVNKSELMYKGKELKHEDLVHAIYPRGIIPIVKNRVDECIFLQYNK